MMDNENRLQCFCESRAFSIKWLPDFVPKLKLNCVICGNTEVVRSVEDIIKLNIRESFYSHDDMITINDVAYI